MKTFLLKTLFVLLAFTNLSQASTCQTFEGLNYECRNIRNMLDTILSNMEVSEDTAYTFNGSAQIQKHIVRYSITGEISNTYFQDYTYYISENHFQLIHYVKTDSSTYSLYIDSNLTPTGTLGEDLGYVSKNVELLGDSKNVRFNSDGYPSAIIYTAKNRLRLSSSKSELSFSIIGGITKKYSFLYRND